MRKRMVVTLALVIPLLLAGATQAGWQNYTVADGLGYHEVTVVFEDSKGNLWFGFGWSGTNESVLSRYDGLNWTSYTGNTCPGYGVEAIAEDGEGNLWFGFGEWPFSGLSRYDGVSWTYHSIGDVHAIITDSSGNLWVGTDDGVSRFDGELWTTYTEADGLADNTVEAITEDTSGNMWFGTGFGGVSRYDGATWTTYTEADGLVWNSVRAIAEDNAGNLWFGTSRGVSCFDGVTWVTYTEDDGLAHNGVEAMTADSKGNLWFGTGGLDPVGFFGHGVSCYDGTGWTTYTTEDGLVQNHVNAIIEDSSGNLWFGAGTRYGGGVSRYDGVSWTTYTTEEGLANRLVRAVTEDTDGNLWLATGGGVSRYDGVSWTTYTTEDGLADSVVVAIAEDSNGNLWVGTYGGVSRYDGISWTTYSTEDGLAENHVYAITEDSNGSLWFGTSGGASRYDGEGWTTFRREDGLAGNNVYAILEDSHGDLWFGTFNSGVSRYDGTSWTKYTKADGAINVAVTITEDSNGTLWFGGVGVSRYDGVNWTAYTTEDSLMPYYVWDIMEDMGGDLWFGTQFGGASRYDGANWTTYTTADGLADNFIYDITEDRNGNLWFATLNGATRHEPDRVAPQTVIWPEPPRLSPGTMQTVTFCAAFGEARDITFSHSLDGSPWSDWSSGNSSTTSGLSDGEHVFKVRARDRVGNVDGTPAMCVFEIDATPPVPLILAPSSGQAVRGSFEIVGIADDPRFDRYRVDVRSVGSELWHTLADSPNAVSGGTLAGWNTTSLPDGNHELRLSVTDTLGLTGTALTRVIVDNEPPWAWETTPAVVSASSGGDVYTTNREVHLYFSPHAFDEAAAVSIDPVDADSVPDNLPGGAELVYAGYEVSWGGAQLRKSATLKMALDDSLVTGDLDGVLALYVLAEGTEWQRSGGTVSPDGKSISVPIDSEGTYSLFVDSGGPGTGRGLSPISFAPRVFSPRGSFGDTEIAIMFTLGRSGPVTVNIYNRAGRLVDDVADGKHMNAGANVVRWDGRDDSGDEVPDGLYVVTVEAQGETRTKTMAVVR